MNSYPTERNKNKTSNLFLSMVPAKTTPTAWGVLRSRLLCSTFAAKRKDCESHSQPLPLQNMFQDFFQERSRRIRSLSTITTRMMVMPRSRYSNIEPLRRVRLEGCNRGGYKKLDKLSNIESWKTRIARVYALQVNQVYVLRESRDAPKAIQRTAMAPKLMFLNPGSRTYTSVRDVVRAAVQLQS